MSGGETFQAPYISKDEIQCRADEFREDYWPGNQILNEN